MTGDNIPLRNGDPKILNRIKTAGSRPLQKDWIFLRRKSRDMFTLNTKKFDNCYLKIGNFKIITQKLKIKSKKPWIVVKKTILTLNIYIYIYRFDWNSLTQQ